MVGSEKYLQVVFDLIEKIPMHGKQPVTFITETNRADYPYRIAGPEKLTLIPVCELVLLEPYRFEVVYFLGA